MSKKTETPSAADVQRAKYGRSTDGETALRASGDLLDGQGGTPPAAPLRGTRTC